MGVGEGVEVGVGVGVIVGVGVEVAVGVQVGVGVGVGVRVGVAVKVGVPNTLGWSIAGAPLMTKTATRPTTNPNALTLSAPLPDMLPTGC